MMNVIDTNEYVINKLENTFSPVEIKKYNNNPWLATLFYTTVISLWGAFNDYTLSLVGQDAGIFEMVEIIKVLGFIMMTGLIMYYGIKITNKKMIVMYKEIVDKNKDLVTQAEKLTVIEDELLVKISLVNKMTMEDTLTGLGSRHAYITDVTEMINNNIPFIAFLVGLDDFKFLNDVYGINIGDKYLELIGEEFKKFKDILSYRLGGDEFIFIIQSHELEQMEATIYQINDIVNRKVEIEEFSIVTSCGIGISIFPKDCCTVEEISQNLDIALNVAKKYGKNRFVIYKDYLKSELIEKEKMNGAIDKAIEFDEFMLFMQPIMNIKTNTFNKYEILLRWEDHSIENHNIGEIINFAEGSGQIKSIDNWVLNNTFKMISENTHVFHDKIISINISTQSFLSFEFLSEIEELIEEFKINPSGIEFEITEYSLIENFTQSMTLMNKLKALGFKIALDDFGTEYSSLNYVSKLPFDTLKIDKSYVDLIIDDDKVRTIVRLIIQMAEELGIDTVAEGIEDIEQLIELENLECHFAQGYLISRPLDSKDVIKMIENNREVEMWV